MQLPEIEACYAISEQTWARGDFPAAACPGEFAIWDSGVFCSSSCSRNMPLSIAAHANFVVAPELADVAPPAFRFMSVFGAKGIDFDEIYGAPLI